MLFLFGDASAYKCHAMYKGQKKKERNHDIIKIRRNLSANQIKPNPPGTHKPDQTP